MLFRSRNTGCSNNSALPPPIWCPSQGSLETIEWAAHPSRKYVYLQAYSPIQSVVRYLNYYREAAQRLHGYTANSDRIGWFVQHLNIGSDLRTSSGFLLRDDQRRFSGTPEFIHSLYRSAQSSGRARVNAGVAIHSLRAASRESIAALMKLVGDDDVPIHIHVAEQTAEVNDCLAATGCRPIEWLARLRLGIGAGPVGADHHAQLCRPVAHSTPGRFHARAPGHGRAAGRQLRAPGPAARRLRHRGARHERAAH